MPWSLVCSEPTSDQLSCEHCLLLSNARFSFHVPTFCQVPAGTAAALVALRGARGHCELSWSLAAPGVAPAATGKLGGICHVALEVIPPHTHWATWRDFYFFCTSAKQNVTTEHRHSARIKGNKGWKMFAGSQNCWLFQTPTKANDRISLGSACVQLWMCSSSCNFLLWDKLWLLFNEIESQGFKLQVI